MELIEEQGAMAVPPQGHSADAPDRRFTDPTVAQIVELWRMRQDMVRAQAKLTLQIKAICRRFCRGSKSEAGRLYKAIADDAPHPLATSAAIACHPLFAAREPVEAARAALEKQLAKLAKALPIYEQATAIKGVNASTLAAIVGECGDLSAYRDHSAVWKRCGLAVIDGERQRRKSGDAALEHGYSPSRRSVIWNVGEALFKAQGKDETAGFYRRIYDARKEHELERTGKAGHAHAAACRYMTKRLIRDLYRMWSGEGAVSSAPQGHSRVAPEPDRAASDGSPNGHFASAARSTKGATEAAPEGHSSVAPEPISGASGTTPKGHVLSAPPSTAAA